jgi:hypothetical protein
MSNLLTSVLEELQRFFKILVSNAKVLIATIEKTNIDVKQDEKSDEHIIVLRRTK